MDRDKLRTVVEGIPAGRWMSYADVCVAAGGFPDEARSVNQRLIQLEVPGAHRVLRADGRIGETALGDRRASGRCWSATASSSTSAIARVRMRAYGWLRRCRDERRPRAPSAVWPSAHCDREENPGASVYAR
jgi:alkylated DNA nucleotide flippase Atl1